MEVRIDKIYGPRIVPVRDYKSKVLNVNISDGPSTAATLTAWDINADFLYYLLSGKEVNQNTYFICKFKKSA